MYHFSWGAVINSAFKRSIEQYFTGTEFQSVFVGSGSNKVFVWIYILESCEAFIQFSLIIVVIICLENAVLFDT